MLLYCCHSVESELLSMVQKLPTLKLCSLSRVFCEVALVLRATWSLWLLKLPIQKFCSFLFVFCFTAVNDLLNMLPEVAQ